MLFYTGFKYCPKCASKAIHDDSVNSMKCEACGFTYFHNAASAVGCIILCQDKIVFLRRNHEPMKGKLDLPGGFVEYNESVEDALRREVREELSFEVKDLEYFGAAGNTYRYKDVAYFTSDVFFITHVESTQEFIPNDEVQELIQLRPNEVDMDQIAFVSAKKMIERLVKK